MTIDQPVNLVYEYISNPKNLPSWASGLSASIRKEADYWISESPMGLVKVKFVEKNIFGILDHTVILPSGIEVYNPMRVFQNHNGSELLFTVYQLPDRSDEKFMEDSKLVEKDLKKLKDLLEGKL
ncbi:SRPBCC family protein [Flavobacterium alkalisoli]|uniref:hypothetical protein n=1 Tax=Flavobacterium alkalisoli TaxID=2602769 RepID=UPI00197B0669|nr:hypothetical protein [Flavobacterium alkalisoli]